MKIRIKPVRNISFFYLHKINSFGKVTPNAKKKHNLAFFFLLVSTFVALTSAATAQKIANGKQSPNTKTEIDTLQAYREISALPMNSNMSERRDVFLKLSAVEKSEVFKFHLAMQLVKRPNLTQEQKDVILEAISIISPETYGDNVEKRSKAQQKMIPFQQTSLLHFSKKDAFEIFAGLGGDAKDIQLLEKYQRVTAPIYQDERRGEFAKSSEQDAANIMKTHLAFEMGRRSLSKEQLNFISEAISFISPEIYAEVKSAQINETMRSFQTRILNYFSKKDAFEIFASLGGERGSPKMVSRTQSSEILNSNKYPGLNFFSKDDAFVIFASLGEKSNAERSVEKQCGCATTDDQCDTWIEGQYCKPGYCADTTWGCGLFWAQICNGLCAWG